MFNAEFLPINRLAHLCVLLVSLLIVCTSIDLKAQETVPASGGNGSGSTGSFSYTVGQIEYTTIIGPKGSAVQGVQQPFEISVGIGKMVDIQLELSVYPNPTTDYLNLKVKESQQNEFQVKLFDLKGKLLKEMPISNEITQIDMNNLEAATYLIYIYNKNSLTKTFKVVKLR